MTIGKTIAEIRKSKGLTRRELAALLEMHPSHITRWERYDVQPRVKALEKLAEVLGTSVPELVAGQAGRVSTQLQEIDDPRLIELMGQVHRLDPKDREALKSVLEAMLTKVQMAELVGHGPMVSRPA